MSPNTHLTEQDFTEVCDQVDDFFGQKIYESFGEVVGQRNWYVRFVIRFLRYSMHLTTVNVLLVALVVLIYPNFRKITGVHDIVAYGLSQNNILAFKKLRAIIETNPSLTMQINGVRLSLMDRLSILFDSKGFLVGGRVLAHYDNDDPFVHLEQILGVAGLIIFSRNRLDTCCRCVAISNDHSPICMALVYLAQQQGLSTIYIQHAPVTEHFPPLRSTLNILHNRASKEAYAKSHQKRNLPCPDDSICFVSPFETNFKEVRVNPNPMTVGIPVGLLFKLDALQHLIAALQNSGDVAHIKLRPHPRDRSERIRKCALPHTSICTPDEKVSEFMDGLDLCVVSNTGIAIESLHYGVPTAYCGGLDDLPDDYYGLVSAKIMPVLDPLHPRKCLEGFFDETWKSRFEIYDSTLEQNNNDMAIATRFAVEALIK